MTIATASAQREALLSLLNDESPYRFLSAAAHYLASTPDDDELRLMMAREYLNLKLIEPACELLDRLSPEARATSAVAGLCQTLAELPAVSIPWEDRRSLFEANLDALSDRGQTVTMIRNAWDTCKQRYRLFIDDHNSPQIQRRCPDGCWQWLPMLGHHQALADAENLPDDINTNFPGPYLLDGVGLGFFAHRLFTKTRNSFLSYSCALYLVEPEPALLALVLHVHDWSEHLRDHRVHVFVGSDCTRQVRQAWTNDNDLPLPTTVLRPSPFRPSPTPCVLETIQQVAQERDRKIRVSYELLEQQYATRDLAYWAVRFREAISGKGQPLRIIAAVSMHTTFLQYSMRDAKRAFEALGHQCLVLKEHRPFEFISPLTYHDTIRQLDPDLFFNIDHLRGSFGWALPSHLPLLTWDQDQLPQVFNRENLLRIAPHDFVVGCSKDQFTRRGGPPKQFANTWVPTNVEQFSGPPLTDEELTQYTCDVSYVSHASQTPKAFHEQERSQWENVQLKRLLDTLYERMPEMLARYQAPDGRLCTTLLNETLHDHNLHLPDVAMRERLLTWYLWRLADRFFRHEALQWVADWSLRRGVSFRIYGHGWDTHPTLSRWAVGPAENGRELLCIHRASRINLQLMPAGFIHQRALDGLSSGGFFLTRLVPLEMRGSVLRKLSARMDELNIHTPDALAACTDEKLASLIEAYLGEPWRRSDPQTGDLVAGARAAVELDYPDEVFPDFEKIVFDSPVSWAQKAEYYLTHEAQRQTLGNTMREVVVQRFSYVPTLTRFLDQMTHYLEERAHGY